MKKFIALFILISFQLGLADPIRTIDYYLELSRLFKTQNNLERVESINLGARIQEIAYSAAYLLPRSHRAEKDRLLEIAERKELTLQEIKEVLSLLESFKKYVFVTEGQKSGPQRQFLRTEIIKILKEVYYLTEHKILKLSELALLHFETWRIDYRAKQVAQKIRPDFIYINQALKKVKFGAELTEADIKEVFLHIYHMDSPGVYDFTPAEMVWFLEKSFLLVGLLESHTEFLKTYNFLFRQLVLLRDILQVDLAERFQFYLEEKAKEKGEGVERKLKPRSLPREFLISTEGRRSSEDWRGFYERTDKSYKEWALLADLRPKPKPETRFEAFSRRFRAQRERRAKVGR